MYMISTMDINVLKITKEFYILILRNFNIDSCLIPITTFIEFKTAPFFSQN